MARESREPHVWWVHWACSAWWCRVRSHTRRHCFLVIHLSHVWNYWKKKTRLELGRKRCTNIKHFRCVLLFHWCLVNESISRCITLQGAVSGERWRCYQALSSVPRPNRTRPRLRTDDVPTVQTCVLLVLSANSRRMYIQSSLRKIPMRTQSDKSQVIVMCSTAIIRKCSNCRRISFCDIMTKVPARTN